MAKHTGERTPDAESLVEHIGVQSPRITQTLTKRLA